MKPQSVPALRRKLARLDSERSSLGDILIRNGLGHLPLSAILARRDEHPTCGLFAANMDQRAEVREAIRAAEEAATLRRYNRAFNR